MRLITWGTAAVLLNLMGPAHAETDEQLEARQKAACLGDAMRLCGWHMPFLGQVKECMRDKKKQVSAACAAFYPPGE